MAVTSLFIPYSPLCFHDTIWSRMAHKHTGKNHCVSFFFKVVLVADGARNVEDSWGQFARERYHRQDEKLG